MENLLWLIPVLACPLMMVAMMLMMGKGMGMMGGDKDAARPKEEPDSRPVAELRAEKERLESEIGRREGAERGAGEGVRAPRATPDRRLRT
ncbi:MAG: hypothetical protein ACRDK9_09375 [Solirubrobacterales bacterium]